MRHRIGLDIRMLQNSGIGTYLRGLLSGLGALGLDKDLVFLVPNRWRLDRVAFFQRRSILFASNSSIRDV